MTLTKRKTVAAVVLGVCIVAAGLGLLLQRPKAVSQERPIVLPAVLELFTVPQILHELALDGEQAGKIGKLMEEKPGKEIEAARKMNLPWYATNEERIKRTEEMRGALDGAARKALKDILGPEQWRRYNQHVIEGLRVRAFFGVSEVQEELRLTSGQREKIKSVREVWLSRLSALPPVRADLEHFDLSKSLALQAKVDPIYDAAYAKVIALLTPEQKKKWEEMTGKPIDPKVARVGP